MTERQLINKSKRLFNHYYSKRIKGHIERLAKSGDLSYELEDIRSEALSKVLLKVVLEDVANEISLYSKEYEEEYENLKKF